MEKKVAVETLRCANDALQINNWSFFFYGLCLWPSSFHLDSTFPFLLSVSLFTFPTSKEAWPWGLHTRRSRLWALRHFFRAPAQLTIVPRGCDLALVLWSICFRNLSTLLRSHMFVIIVASSRFRLWREVKWGFISDQSTCDFFASWGIPTDIERAFFSDTIRIRARRLQANKRARDNWKWDFKLRPVTSYFLHVSGWSQRTHFSTASLMNARHKLCEIDGITHRPLSFSSFRVVFTSGTPEILMKHD